MGAAVGLDGFEPPKERVLGIALANSDDSALSSLSMDGFFFDFVDVAPLRCVDDSYGLAHMSFRCCHT